VTAHRGSPGRYSCTVSLSSGELNAHLLACSMEMKLTPTLTSTAEVERGKVTHPASTLPSPSITPRLTLPLCEIPELSNGSEKRATK
jgi:hypothetical protein